VLILSRVLNTVVAVSSIWAVTTITDVVTLAQVQTAAISAPAWVALTEPVGVAGGVLHTVDTVEWLWAGTTEQALIVTATLPDSA
jgi:hypothetical protein